MSSGRRYSEEEMRAIFERASEIEPEADRLAPAPAAGMTLEELQSIGREVGIPADRVARAATELELAQPGAIVRRLAGLPIGVGRIVELGRQLTDAEWDRLVSRLRETFDAKGVVRVEGGLRQWSNGNLQVFLEPGDAGHRIRFRTVKGSALAMFRMAGTMLVGSGIVALALALTGTLGDRGAGPLIVAVGGAVAILATAARLPAWARERARQMDLLATKMSESFSDPP